MNDPVHVLVHILSLGYTAAHRGFLLHARLVFDNNNSFM